MIFWIFKEPGSNVLLRQMHGVLSSSETVKLDSDWKRRRRIFGNVSWFFLNEWRIALDNYAAKHDNLFNFICIQRTRISFMLRDQLSFTVSNWFKKIFFLSPKIYFKKETSTQILQHGISPALFEFYLFRTFLNKQGNFTFLPGRLPSLSERQCLKASSRKFPEINKNIHSW